MSLFKRGQIWWVQIKRDNRLIRESTGTADRGIAKKKEAGLIVDFDKHGLRNKGKKKTFKDMADRYMQEYAIQKAPKSMRRDKFLLKHLLPVFGDLSLIRITPDRIVRYKTQRRNEGASAKSINHELGFSKHAFNLGIREWEWVSDNPFMKVSMEKLPQPRVRYLTREEFDRLYQACSDRLKPIVLFAVNTGIRQDNILTLTWKQVDFITGVIMLEHTKNGDRLGLPMNNKVKNLLMELNKIRHINNDYVFSNSKGNKLCAVTVQKTFRKTCKKTGITDFRFHDLRHTFASWLVQNGIDLYRVQRLLGHKTGEMTRRYAHLAPDNLKDSVAILDQFEGTGITIRDHSGI